MEIREKQIQVLKAAVERRFEDQMIVHLGAFSPPLFKATGEQQMRLVIGLGISKAVAYGFENRGPVRLYLEMMLLFGSHFDTDPQYPWAAEILKEQDLPQMERAELLFGRLRHYREAVGGPSDAYTLDSLRNIRARSEQPFQVTSDAFIAPMLAEIARIYPQKADYTGPDALEALIGEARELASRFGFGGARELALMVVLMLAFGHGCADDPLYPWIGRTLNDKAIKDPTARAGRLETKALTWLDHVLAYFDQNTI